MLLIDGTWQAGSGEPFISSNPATGEQIWSGNAATVEDVDRAVTAATAAQIRWSRCSSDERAAVLKRFAALLGKHAERLTQAISQETGKALWDSAGEVKAMQAKIEVSLQALEERRAPQRVPLGDGFAATRYKPHGVMAVFGPFNFPGHIANGQIVPALAAGNAVLFKPSELTPRVAEETVKLWQQAGLPNGVLNLLQGPRGTGEALVNQPGVQGILFTGSLKTGLAIRQALVDHPEKILALELGGNNPLVVHRPRNVDAAAYCALQSAFLSGGQRCTCARRLIVTPGQDEFIERLIQWTQGLRLGPPDTDPQPFYGTLIHASAVDSVLEEQSRLLDAGAHGLMTARRLEWSSAAISPGILDVTRCSAREDQEVFGPLLQVIRVDSLDEAIQEANNTRYGLVASLLAESADDFEVFWEHVHAGLINWNRPTTGASGRLPFGGVGCSGNHRPAGYFMVDACNIPVASLESDAMTIPETLSPGVVLP